MGDYILRKTDKILRKGEDVVVCLPSRLIKHLEKEQEVEETVGCTIVTGNSTLTVGLVNRSPNISIDENEKVQKAIKEVSKRDCIIVGDFSHVEISTEYWE